MVKPKKREKKSKTRHHAVESDEGVGAGSGGGDSVSMNDDANVDNEVARRDKARRDKAIRSAKRHKKRMAELGLDLNGAPLDNYSLSKYPVRECKLSIRGFKEQVVLNPVVNGIGIVGLWGVVAWAQGMPLRSTTRMYLFRYIIFLTASLIFIFIDTVNPIGATATLSLWSSQIVLNLSWLLQFSCAYTFFFILYILYKYGHVHLGRKSEKPEFSLLTATAMILASATGPSILIFGVAEPPPNRFGNFFAMAGYRSQDEVDLFAVNLAVFKWGMISWTHIALVAIGVSLASNHFGLPLTLRSCFLPTFKSYTWGWIGDVIDGCAIISTVTGACGTMTFTCFQVVVSLVYIKVVNDTEEDIGAAIALAILLVTVLSTASVISGLRGGVRFFSRLAFGLSTLLLCLVLFLDDTKFLLNLQVQEFGYFLQTSLFQLNFWTDAFGQLREGSGRAIDDGASDEKWYSKHVVLFYASYVLRFGSPFDFYLFSTDENFCANAPISFAACSTGFLSVHRVVC